MFSITWVQVAETARGDTRVAFLVALQPALQCLLELVHLWSETGKSQTHSALASLLRLDPSDSGHFVTSHYARYLMGFNQLNQSVAPQFPFMSELLTNVEM